MSSRDKSVASATQGVKLPDGIQVFERGWLSSNNILLTGDGQTALIDSGYCTHSDQTLELVTDALGTRSLDFLVNTHLHSDHCGGNAALQRHYPNIQTLIPPGQAASVQRWDPTALTYTPTGQTCPQFRFDQTLQPGKEITLGRSVWEVHAAAGHDPHSVILFEPQDRVLISADALWENGFGVVFPELEGVEAFAEVGATLDLIRELSPNTVIPGHGRVFAFTREILDRARQRLDAFIDSPSRHAHHGVKVLLKFKLLEFQQLPLTDFVVWALATPYFSQIHRMFFRDQSIEMWINRLIGELVKSGAANRSGDLVLNA